MNYMAIRRPLATVNSGVSNGLSSASSFDRLFDSIFSSMPGWNDREMPVNIRAEEQEYVVDADMPGLTEDKISVRVEDNLLVIESNTEDNVEEKVDSYILRERGARSFYRSFALPKDADPGKIEGTYKNGVLTVTIAKKPEAKPRQIKISRG